MDTEHGEKFDWERDSSLRTCQSVRIMHAVGTIGPIYVSSAHSLSLSPKHGRLIHTLRHMPVHKTQQSIAIEVFRCWKSN